MTMHLSFLRRTSVGPASFTVKDLKLGARTSTILITLTQDESREEVMAIVTQSNLRTEAGPSFSTSWTLAPPSPPVSLPALTSFRPVKPGRQGTGDDENWVEQTQMPFSDFRRASKQVRWFFPRKGQSHASTVDQWIKLTVPGQRFREEDLGFVADTFPQILEAYRSGNDDEYDAADKEENMNRGPVEASKQSGAKNRTSTQARGTGAFWYPTVLLNLDVKKALPIEGVEWLFVRIRAKQIKGGRFDLEVIIMDEVGELVALSHHVCLAVDASRNLAKRGAKTKEKGGEARRDSRL